ncbi:competence protein CoiA family protein [uncultured Sunxiuqinia sp.]|uniref:competence protein CoiA family protein n=1 Tax=uncultured Sunxiuqinia sp. TaxID=1573825 RepID=UPI002AA6AEBA|nr:competence protein CoiA family protein [uncultured Sunxiuqinia sp.]
MDIKLPYAYKDGKLVTIDDVEKGLACNCYCPNCKSRLLARHGNIREHHFSHYKNEDCGWKGESIIHKLSKDIISKHKFIKAPRLLWQTKPEIIIYDETYIPIDKIKLEHKIDKIIPDILIESKGKELIIELKVSHGINYDKYLKIKRLNISTIEIDVRELINQLFKQKDYYLTDPKFEDALVNNPNCKYWIFNTEKERLRKIILKDYSKKLLIKRLKSNQDFYCDLIYVDDCPISKRTWNSGFKEGKSYAKIEEDCRLCKYFLGSSKFNNYDSNTAMELFESGFIYCFGHLSTKTDYQIDSIIYNNKKKINYKNTKHNIL